MLRKEYGAGYSATNLKLFRQFYLFYPELMPGRIGHTLRDQLPDAAQELQAIQAAFPTVTDFERDFPFVGQAGLRLL